MKSKIRLFGGIEGGGTKTTCSLISENGQVLCTEIGGPTNPWLLGKNSNENGFVIASRRIYELINKLLDSLISVSSSNNELEYELVAVGLCMSGAGCKEVHEKITYELKKLGANFKIYIANDTLAPIFTAFENGGIVIISGTGSKCVLVNPINDLSKITSFDDIVSYSSGGWGNLLGDEASAYWIAQKAIKYVIDYYDNLIDDSNMSVVEREAEELKQIIFDHFKIKTFDDLLPYFYSDFQKDFIASLSAKLAKVAEDMYVIKNIFEESGYEIARHILALIPKADKKLLATDHGLPVVCAGSVFKSWKIIKPGFVRYLEKHAKKYSSLNELNLVTINGDSTIGAAVLASKLYDNKLDLFKNIERNNLISQLDYFNLKKLIGESIEKED